MRRAPAWLAVVGVLAAWLSTPIPAQAGVWVTLAAGLPGVVAPTSSSEFLFDNPHAPYIAVNQLTGGTTAEATTGGGTSFFGGAGTPVLLNTGDGSAYIASGSPPASAKTGGAGGGTPASSAPVAGGSVPSNAALLGLNLADPSNGSRILTATITDALGNPLGSNTVTVPDGGWWVLGLGQNTQTEPPVNPDPGPIVIPIPDQTESPTQLPRDNGVATPEPGSFALAAVGITMMHTVRRLRARNA